MVTPLNVYLVIQIHLFTSINMRFDDDDYYDDRVFYFLYMQS